MMLAKTYKLRGLTLIEALVFLFIFSVVVIAFYQALNLGTQTIIDSKNRLGAISVANEKMEIFRSLDYVNVGTKRSDGAGGWVYGNPRGDMLEYEQVSKNTRAYYVHTIAYYRDDTFDGIAGEADVRPADYKEVRIQVSWGGDYDDPKKSIVLVGRFVPPGVEAITVGGILSINVLDASNSGIGQASIRIVNPSVSLDDTKQADSSGNLMYLEAPVAQNYQIYVTKSGYYPVQTYVAYDPSISGSFVPVNSNPTVTAGGLETIGIKTDRVSHITFQTRDALGNIIPSVQYAIEGGRRLGDDGSTGAPIFSYDQDVTTDAEGSHTIENDLSFGDYTFTLNSVLANYEFIKLDCAGALPNSCYLPPNTDLTITAKFADKSTDSLLASVVNNVDSSPVQGANVRLTNVGLGYDNTLTSDQFGKAFFPNDATLLDSTQYQIEVSAPGFATINDTVDINNLTLKEIRLVAN